MEVSINAVPISLSAIADGAVEARFLELVEELRCRAEEQPALMQEGRPCYATQDGDLVGTLALVIETRVNPDTGSIVFKVKKLETKAPDLKIDDTPARFIMGRPMIETNIGKQTGLPFQKHNTAI